MAGDTLNTVEARYRALFETMGPAVLLMRGPACIDCNPATLGLFGVARREDFIGKSVMDFAPEVQPSGERSADLVHRNVVEALERGSKTFEWQSIRTNGERFLMEVQFTPCGPPEEGLFLCIAVDITRRRHDEEALKRSEERFRAIVENSSDGVLVVDTATREIRYANPRSHELLGHPQLPGRSIDELGVGARGVLEALQPDALHPAHGTELALRRYDGEPLDVRMRAAHVELEGRRSVVVLFTDLTVQRRHEAERLRAMKLEAVGRLAGGIAHDFNNLLQAVLGQVSLARLSDDPGERRELLDEAVQALGLSSRLANQLLTFARGGTPVTQRVALGPLVESAARLAVSGTNISIEVSFAPDLWAVEVDTGQFSQVVHSLVARAVEAMPQGGLLRVSATNRPTPDGNRVAVAIADDGPALPVALRARVFEPYATTQGSGLGLATAWSIVTRHQGTLELLEGAARGNTFMVTLPAFPDVRPEPAAVSKSTRPGRILLMDDDALVRTASGRMLRALGHHVDVAAHGDEAVARYREALEARQPYDLVILDLTVRGGNGGLDAISKLRALDPNVTAIVSSGYSDDAGMASYRAHGFAGALPKPYDFTALEAMLRAHLGAR
ncbi:MAG: PAS domain S-box protein [Myxococcaceae bacterium]|nr:PAS domain S-box protein [Myxococcaceae bacterium]